MNKQLLQVASNLMNKQSLHSIYFTHVHSHLNYGLLAWGCMANKAYLNDIFKLQKQCVRIISKQHKHSNHVTLFEQCSIFPLEKMIKLELTKFGYKISKKILPSPLINMLNIKGGKKSHQYPM